MMNITKTNSSTFSFLISLLLIILWAYGGFSKLLALDTFRMQLNDHRLISKYASFFSRAVPVLELCIAAVLCFEKTRKAGFVLSMILLAIFTTYIIYMFVFYSHRPCSCGGIIPAFSWKGHIIFNLVFLLLALMGLLCFKNIFRRHNVFMTHEPIGNGHYQGQGTRKPVTE